MKRIKALRLYGFSAFLFLFFRLYVIASENTDTKCFRAGVYGDGGTDAAKRDVIHGQTAAEFCEQFFAKGFCFFEVVPVSDGDAVVRRGFVYLSEMFFG